MSSVAVRTKIKQYLTNEFPSEKQSDLSGGFFDIYTHLAEGGIQTNGPWLGLQFLGGDEVPVTVGSNGTKGKYREDGAVYIHVVDIASPSARDSILGRAEALRSKFRGRRIDEDILIQSVTPPSFEAGATIDFEAGYISASFIIEYSYDLNL